MTSSKWKRRGKEAWGSLVTTDYKVLIKNHILFKLPLAKEKEMETIILEGSVIPVFCLYTTFQAGQSCWFSLMHFRSVASTVRLHNSLNSKSSDQL